MQFSVWRRSDAAVCVSEKLGSCLCDGEVLQLSVWRSATVVCVSEKDAAVYVAEK